LGKNMTPDAAQRAAQDIWNQGRSQLAAGMPREQLDQIMPPNFNRQQAGNFTAAFTSKKDRLELENKLSSGWTQETDTGRWPNVAYLRKGNRTTTLDGKPYTPTGTEAKDKPDLFKGVTRDGKELTLVPSPSGGWTNFETGEQVTG